MLVCRQNINEPDKVEMKKIESFGLSGKPQRREAGGTGSDEGDLTIFLSESCEHET